MGGEADATWGGGQKSRMQTNTTKAKLAEGEVVFGAILSRYAPALTELPAPCAQRLAAVAGHASHRRHHGLTRVGAGLESAFVFPILCRRGHFPTIQSRRAWGPAEANALLERDG